MMGLFNTWKISGLTDKASKKTAYSMFLLGQCIRVGSISDELIEQEFPFNHTKTFFLDGYSIIKLYLKGESSAHDDAVESLVGIAAIMFGLDSKQFDRIEIRNLAQGLYTSMTESPEEFISVNCSLIDNAISLLDKVKEASEEQVKEDKKKLSESEIILLDNGHKYEGQWKDGKQHGSGTLTYADGSKYEGQWKDDKQHGSGTLTFANGDKYEGQWKDDKQHGSGTYIFADGEKYEGQWKDDKKHGSGTYTFASGNKYEGQWKDDKKHGSGTFTYADGSKYEGQWKDGKQHGSGTFTYADGSKKIVEFKNDKLQ